MAFFFMHFDRMPRNIMRRSDSTSVMPHVVDVDFSCHWIITERMWYKGMNVSGSADTGYCGQKRLSYTAVSPTRLE
jgi:hypothetical protein